MEASRDWVLPSGTSWVVGGLGRNLLSQVCLGSAGLHSQSAKRGLDSLSGVSAHPLRWGWGWASEAGAGVWACDAAALLGDVRLLSLGFISSIAVLPVSAGSFP